MIESLLKPFQQIFTNPPHQLHPAVVHFPIVFVLAEAVLIGWFAWTKKPELWRWAAICLRVGFLSMWIAALAGFHDVGLGAGQGNRVWLGMQDRWRNMVRFESSVTVHVWLALLLIASSAARLLWHWRGAGTLQGPKAIAYGALILLNLWLLAVVGYVGGSLVHG